ncbi:hypothetical protein OFO07_01565 [Campylobacter sp. JMF_06 NA1]|uniref:hypothetical protein n=1 Tax=Campylobacter sp. JMF_06 NA1 TaxID=2983823 RepID=UPI0022E9F9D6|nr:hypothetical protein [Campylobacter sp. JMF_06 NA1]MDA3077610.1 hypothetical protein [Campylobacter sp. JMF_06 NA1]
MYAFFIIIASLLVATWYLQNTAGTMFKAFVLGAICFVALCVVCDFGVVVSFVISVLAFGTAYFILHKNSLNKNEIIINLEVK